MKPICFLELNEVQLREALLGREVTIFGLRNMEAEIDLGRFKSPYYKRFSNFPSFSCLQLSPVYSSFLPFYQISRVFKFFRFFQIFFVFSVFFIFLQFF